MTIEEAMKLKPGDVFELFWSKTRYKVVAPPKIVKKELEVLAVPTKVVSLGEQSMKNATKIDG